MCKGLEYFHVNATQVKQLREIHTKNKALYEGHIMDVFTQQPGNKARAGKLGGSGRGIVQYG